MTAPYTTRPALVALLERVVDYAGLFPPAGLTMEDAVRAYAEYRQGADAWMLGRFVLPAGRLHEFEQVGGAAGVLPQTAATSWALSALIGPDAASDLAAVEAFNARHRDARAGAVHVDTLELRAADAGAIAAAVRHARGFEIFVELPVASDPAPLVAALAEQGANAKIRTGGLTPDAIPPATQVARFMRRCLEGGVAFKATAGLHHPVSAEYPLTYAPDAPRGVMYGHLNLLLAAAFLRQGLDDAGVRAVLEERDASAFRVDADHVAWRDRRVRVDGLRVTRHQVVAFGSCSFREPVCDLRALGLL